MPVLLVELVMPQHQPRVTVSGREGGRKMEECKRGGGRRGEGCIEEEREGEGEGRREGGRGERMFRRREGRGGKEGGREGREDV